MAAAVISAALACQVIVLASANAAASLEFTAGVRALHLKHALSETPAITATYRDWYRCSWWWLPASLLWALWLLHRRQCSLLSLVCYVGVCVNLAALWTVFTLLALYVGNQVFYT